VLFLKLLDSPIFHLFSNLYIGSELINTYTTKFSQPLTKHSNLATPPIPTIFILQVQSDTRTCSFATFTLSVSSRLKITDRYLIFLCNALLKELCQSFVHSSQANLFDSTAPLLALSISHFHSKLKTHLFQRSFPH